MEGWCFQSCSASCCSVSGCFLWKISCSDSTVFSHRRQRTLTCLTVWLNQAEGTLCFPSVSTQPSIQPGIDDLPCRLKKGEMCKTRGEGSRNGIFLTISIIIITVSTTPGVFNHLQQNEDWTQQSPGHLDPEVSLQTTTRMTGNELCILKDPFSSKSLMLQRSTIGTQWEM